MTKVFGVWIYALSSPSYQDFSFQDARLQLALEFYKEGQQSLVEEKYRDACDAFMTGVFSGRRVVEELQASGANEESATAMSWLITSYMECAKARMKLGDWQTARSDAWAACMFSQNQNLDALKCMLTVCENTNDLFGQLSTLKAILPLLVERAQAPDSPLPESHGLSLETVRERIDKVEILLQQKFTS